jgi:hypothetical protein
MLCVVSPPKAPLRAYWWRLWPLRARFRLIFKVVRDKNLSWHWKVGARSISYLFSPGAAAVCCRHSPCGHQPPSPGSTRASECPRLAGLGGATLSDAQPTDRPCNRCPSCESSYKFRIARCAWGELCTAWRIRRMKVVRDKNLENIKLLERLNICNHQVHNLPFAYCWRWNTVNSLSSRLLNTQYQQYRSSLLKMLDKKQLKSEISQKRLLKTDSPSSTNFPNILL